MPINPISNLRLIILHEIFYARVLVTCVVPFLQKWFPQHWFLDHDRNGSNVCWSLSLFSEIHPGKLCLSIIVFGALHVCNLGIIWYIFHVQFWRLCAIGIWYIILCPLWQLYSMFVIGFWYIWHVFGGCTAWFHYYCIPFSVDGLHRTGTTTLQAITHPYQFCLIHLWLQIHKTQNQNCQFE